MIKTQDDVALRQEFLSAIDESGILNRATPMGTLGARVYENGGDRRFKRVRSTDSYTVSRSAARLTHAKARDIVTSIGGVEHIYFLGTHHEEATAFAQHAPELKQCSVIDIAPAEVEKNVRALQTRLGKIEIAGSVTDYQKETLPGSEHERRVVVYPSANIGNTIGFYGQDPSENVFLNQQFANLRASASHLVVVFDTEKDEKKLRHIYNSDASKAFVTGVFDYIAARLNITGLKGSHFALDSRWDAASSAQLHTAICVRGSDLEHAGRVISLIEDQQTFPAHSYKLEQDQMEHVAGKNGWRLGRVDTDDSSIVIHTYE